MSKYNRIDFDEKVVEVTQQITCLAGAHSQVNQVSKV